MSIMHILLTYFEGVENVDKSLRIVEFFEGFKTRRRGGGPFRLQIISETSIRKQRLPGPQERQVALSPPNNAQKHQ